MSPRTMERILEGRRSQPQQLIEALQDIQDDYGYISEESMKSVSEGLGVPLIEVYRVAKEDYKMPRERKNHKEAPK